MTHEEIIAMAREAGITFVTEFGVASATPEFLTRFADLVAAREREAWIAALQPAITRRMGAEQVREAIQKVIHYRRNQ